MITRAYQVAAEAHRSQLRSSGESYINHPLAVARIVADIGLDEITVAAALLHDAVEDTEITSPTSSADFGAEVAAIVDGVTKLDRIQFDSTEAQQAATMRKMLVAMAKDLRVLIIKLADRLHNMRTIAAMPAGEAAAHRPGDARHLRPAGPPPRHAGDEAAARGPRRSPRCTRSATPRSTTWSAARSPEREVYLAAALAEVRARLAELGIDAEVTGRGKHLWSIYEKMVVKGREFDDIFDLVGDPGHRRLGQGLLRRARLHPRSLAAGGGPVQGLHRDAEVQPLPALHTTVIGPAGQADRGADPHPRDAPAGRVGRRRPLGVQGAASPTDDIDWLNRIIDWQADVTDPAQFMENLKTDLEQDEVFVFTPKGRVITLPLGADADRLRLRRAHRGRPRLHRGQGQRPPGAARPPAVQRRHVRDLHVEGRDAPGRRRTG